MTKFHISEVIYIRIFGYVFCLRNTKKQYCIYTKRSGLFKHWQLDFYKFL